MQFRKSVDPEEKLLIASTIARHHPRLRDASLFRDSIPGFVEDLDWHFIVVTDETPGDDWAPYACGIIGEYRQPMMNARLFGVEALWFADDSFPLHMEIITAVANAARNLGVRGLCIAGPTLSHESTLQRLLEGNRLESLPELDMQGGRPDLYSAFSESPGRSLFTAHCLAINLQQEQLDFGGVVAGARGQLFRGDGRLSTPGPNVASGLRALVDRVFAEGFRPRAQGRFAGTVLEQLLQQGYVDQPTVSLSESFEVGAYYGTEKHSREGAVVFTIDRAGLMEGAPVYDSMATLEKCCPWILGGFHDLIVRVMAALDGDAGDVRRSGAFLEWCHRISRERVEQFGGGSLGPSVDWTGTLDPDTVESLEQAGLGTEGLDRMIQEFEWFWNVALGKMEVADRIRPDGRLAESVRLSRAYYEAFGRVESRLKEAWEARAMSRYNHPGWDLSAFGYITKTIRDREFFSDGAVPGRCVVEATLVDRSGQPLEVVRNPQAA
jgi:hypothetical protein